MPALLFASHNDHKIKELRQLLPGFEIFGLNDLDITEEIPETGTTLEENSALKARYLAEKTGKAVIADDSGLEVDALNGAPGVYSARYAEGPRSDEANMVKLLKALANTSNRAAQFRTVISLVIGERIYAFEGIVRGNLLEAKRGAGGFGYDPLFVPEGFDRTFAEMKPEEKNALSHRGRAVAQLKAFIETHPQLFGHHNAG
jgi:XTP/dITP diphosphohydrolase